MTNRDDRIRELYEQGRHHPYGRSHDRFPSPDRSANRAGDHREIQGNQFRENEHHSAYDNDVRKTSWLQSGVAAA
jgi:hypothetical protein